MVHSIDRLDWTFFHLRKMLYQRLEGSSTPEKPFLPWRKVNVLAIYSESNHEYRLSGPTSVVHNADWLYLNTFPPVEDSLPSTGRLLNTWRKWFRHEGNSIFWPCYWITPWIHTFWAHCSGIQSWLASPKYQSTHGIWVGGLVHPLIFHPLIFREYEWVNLDLNTMLLVLKLRKGA